MTALPPGGSAAPQHREQSHGSAPQRKSFEERKQGDVRSHHVGRNEADVVDAEADVVESLLTLQFQSGNPGNGRVLQIASSAQQTARRPSAEDDPDGAGGSGTWLNSRPNSGAGSMSALMARPNSFTGKKRKPLVADEEAPSVTQLNSYRSDDYRELVSATEATAAQHHQLATEMGHRRQGGPPNDSPTFARAALQGLAGRVPSDPLLNGGQRLSDAVLARMGLAQGPIWPPGAADAAAPADGEAPTPSAKRLHVVGRPQQHPHQQQVQQGNGGGSGAGGGGSGGGGSGCGAGGAVTEGGPPGSWMEDGPQGPGGAEGPQSSHQHSRQSAGGAAHCGGAGGGGVTVKQEGGVAGGSGGGGTWPSLGGTGVAAVNGGSGGGGGSAAVGDYHGVAPEPGHGGLAGPGPQAAGAGGGPRGASRGPQAAAPRRRNPPSPLGHHSEAGSEPSSPFIRHPPSPGKAAVSAAAGGAAAADEHRQIGRRDGGAGYGCGGGGGGGSGLLLNGMAAEGEEPALAPGPGSVLSLLQLLAVHQRQQQQQQQEQQQQGRDAALQQQPYQLGCGLDRSLPAGQGRGGPGGLSELADLAGPLTGTLADRAPPRHGRGPADRQQTQQLPPLLLPTDPGPAHDPRVSAGVDLGPMGGSAPFPAAAAPVDRPRAFVVGGQHRGGGGGQEGTLPRQVSYNSRDVAAAAAAAAAAVAGAGGDAMQVDSPGPPHRTGSGWAEVQSYLQQHPQPPASRFPGAERGPPLPPPPGPEGEAPYGGSSHASGTQQHSGGGGFLGGGGGGGGEDRIHASLAAIERKLLLQEERLVYELKQVRLMKRLLHVQQMKQMVREAMREKERFEEAGAAAAAPPGPSAAAAFTAADAAAAAAPPEVAHHVLLRQGSFPAPAAAAGPAAALVAALAAANGGAGLDPAALEALRGALGELVMQRAGGPPEVQDHLTQRHQPQQPPPPPPQPPQGRRPPANATDMDHASMYDEPYSRTAKGQGVDSRAGVGSGLHRMRSGIELGTANGGGAAGEEDLHGAGGGMGPGRLLSYMAALSGKAQPEARQQQQPPPPGVPRREVTLAADRLRELDRDRDTATVSERGGAAGPDKAPLLGRQQQPQQHMQVDAEGGGAGRGGGGSAGGGIDNEGGGGGGFGGHAAIGSAGPRSNAPAAAAGRGVGAGVDLQGILEATAASGGELSEEEVALVRRRVLQALLLQHQQQLLMHEGQEPAAAAAGAAQDGGNSGS